MRTIRQTIESEVSIVIYVTNVVYVNMLWLQFVFKDWPSPTPPHISTTQPFLTPHRTTPATAPRFHA